MADGQEYPQDSERSTAEMVGAALGVLLVVAIASIPLLIFVAILRLAFGSR